VAAFRLLPDAELLALAEDVRSAASARDQVQQMRLYRQAGEHYLAAHDIDQGCFFITNAWVLALANGDDSEHELHQLLAAHGRVPV